jgi:hypothetical protein
MNSYNENQAIVGEQILNSLYQKSWDSPEFKHRLINSPISTIEEVVGNKISNNFGYVVEDQSSSSYPPHQLHLYKFKILG